MLCFFLQPACSACQLVLLLPRLCPGGKGNLTDWGQGVDIFAQLVKLFSNGCQLLGVCCKVVSVASPRLPAVFDPMDGDIVAEHWVNDLVQLVRVVDGRVEGQLLALGPLSLDIVLPEVSLLL